jgi:uncharacterized protein
MKFQPDHLEGVNSIARHDASGVWLGPQGHTRSIVVPWKGPVQDWPPERFDDLQALHFDALIGLNPELVLFGSGARLRFAAPALLRGLIERRIGFETMDTAAACRTFNVLVSEGRLVVAALLLDRQMA